jgi:hypothetical protein
MKAFPAFVLAAALGLSAIPATAQPAGDIAAGKMVYAANNQRLGAVYRVADDSVQLIVDGKMKSLPLSTVSAADGKIVTTLTKAEVMKSR